MKVKSFSLTYVKFSFTIIFAIALFWTYKPPQTNNNLISFILDFSFLFLASINLHFESRNYALISLTIFIIVFLDVLLSYKNYGTSLFESIRALKWLLFIGMLSSVQSKKEAITEIFINKLTKTLLGLAFAKYLISVIFSGLQSRPFLLGENNYELVLFFELFIISYHFNNGYSGKFSRFWFWILTLVTVLSRSVSGAIMLMYISYKTYRKINRANSFQITTILFGFLGVNYVMLTRAYNFLTSDRAYFVRQFWSHLKDNSFFEILFGNFYIKPLNSDVCSSLLYYVKYLSNSQDGTCYSVVYHSFILRQIVDFGIIGLILGFFVLTSILISKLNKKLAQDLLILALINSISVSGINSSFVLFPFLLAILTRNSLKKVTSFENQLI